ncbi:hypothetical protein BaRGS_00016825 [Batillaria attramentaria]|uniref:Uncharacterized protein n=1 Tax=Batillaria attramentaria TaxID=370345 RepID=A0ABD0KYU1_9CAEN
MARSGGRTNKNTLCTSLVVLVVLSLMAGRVQGSQQQLQQPTGRFVQIVAVISILGVRQVETSQLTNRLFQWTRHPEDYTSVGKSLSGHTFFTYTHKYVSSQCALECLRNYKCKSFNFDRDTGRCELNDASHYDSPDDLVDVTSCEYHTREAFSIDPEALGPCAQNPCGDRGHCIETKDASDDLLAVCLCHDGWTGTRCQLKANALEWGEWEDWGQCSVTCHRGWRMRSRKCEDTVTQQTVSSLECYGADVEYGVCVMPDCPRWEAWGEWGECSASRTCGRGVKVRHRACSNGGVPGVDRYCLGSTNQSTPCEGIDCRGAMQLRGGVEHGEGRLELYNDLTGEWGLLCADQITTQAAHLACKQLGFPGAHAAVTDGRFGAGDVSFALTTLRCEGGERSLLQCPHNVWKTNSTCGSGNNMAAGVQCNVNGVWSLWSSWSDCSVTCENGTRHRTRTCNHPPQMHAGSPCEGEDIQFKPCQLSMCPNDGTWSDWSEWSTCDTSCTASRVRTCISSVPCIGPDHAERECEATECVVDGVWGPWSDWTLCSLSCGNGTQERTRACQGPLYGGAGCEGDDLQTQQCKLRECPVDGVWDEWGQWSECTLTCGNGTRTRSRTCTGPFYGGKECEGSVESWESCNDFSCPVDGEWFPWQQWQPCNVTCGGGVQIRERVCNTPQFGGKTCDGVSMETRECGNNSCPIDGVWLEWSDWGTCSVTCGNGTQYRTRTCDGPYHGGAPCAGNDTDSQMCHPRMCPVDGHWMEWEPWSVCTVSCGGGSRKRTRECYVGKHGGKNCEGEASETEECNTRECGGIPGDKMAWTVSGWLGKSGVNAARRAAMARACAREPVTDPFTVEPTAQDPGTSLRPATPIHVQPTLQRVDAATLGWPVGMEGGRQILGDSFLRVDGVIGEWQEWSPCSLTCGGGLRSRDRPCIGPFYGGAPCAEHLNETEACNEHPCPIDGVWDSWAEWFQCNVTCGGGTRMRERTCKGPYHGGANCSGDWEEMESCNTHFCPVDGVWSDWTEWGMCDVTCGGGSQQRQRTCVGPFHGGAACEGEPEERQACNTHHCPVDGLLSAWGEWSQCDVTCGGGVRWRERTCEGPFHGGADCDGALRMNSTCNTHFCPVDGVWEEWGTWSECTVTCGAGSQWRARNCTGPFYDGADCQGPGNETQICNDFHCPVDGFYGDWSDWGACSVTCGGGSQERNRTCTPPKYGGQDCQGPDHDTQTCNTHNCPVDGYWNDWSDWSSCNTTCGGGTSQRTRLCVEPLHGGKPCEGPPAEYKSCAENPCPIPGDWLPWTPWSPCSTTCGGGQKERSRECDMTSYGDLTAPCEGDDHELADCHTFSCLPLARTCSEWKDKGLTASTVADVDPDGDDELEPVEVYCDLEAEGGRGVTVIGHDSEARERVKGYEGAMEYDKEVTYNISIDHVISIIDQSEFCSQFIRWECRAALIHNTVNGLSMTTTGWLNRTKGLADYFGGAAPGSNACACGMTNSCGTKKGEPVLCYCDLNDNEWREDSGNLTYKADLPVTHFRAGDTGGKTEDGYQTVGRVLCWGAA